MPTSDESQLAALLQRAAARVEARLSQQEVDEILGVGETASDGPDLPEQRSDSAPRAVPLTPTDSGDQRWLNHIDERHRRERC